MSFSKNLAVLMVVSQKVYSLARRAQWFLASTRGLVVVSWRVTIGRGESVARQQQQAKCASSTSELYLNLSESTI
jgi:hypothetical protein